MTKLKIVKSLLSVKWGSRPRAPLGSRPSLRRLDLPADQPEAHFPTLF